MHRLPLADELPYRFRPPKLTPWVVRATKGFRGRMLRGEHRVERIDIEGIENLRPILGGGDAVLLTPNHCDRADGLVVLELADRVDRPFCGMAAHQIFAGSAGLRPWLFSRMGLFPVDREGADLSAVKAAIEILTTGRHPLVVFPEGEVYHMADKVTPLREGVAFLAATAARKLADSGRTAWIVPIGLKYRFLDDHDPMPALAELMHRLETRFTWWPRPDLPLIERIYRYAEGMLALKELEYFDEARAGALPERIATLRSHILERIEQRHFGATRPGDVPSRVKDLRRQCLVGMTAETKSAMQRDLNDLFVAVQLFSYPGDYVRECPTVERTAEVLIKFEEDMLDSEFGVPRGPRRAIVKIGEPIDVGARLRAGGKLRAVASRLTSDLESRMQGLLDAIGPGRPLAL